ncbi:MAG: barstar family protein [Catenulisporales bacterium]|nr:barstar family protein [Catenulisporales bacterium]
MTALAHVLGEAGPGVHVWHSQRTLSRIRAEAEEIGWRCVVVDGPAATDKASFLDECERAYRFPDYFGHNWDALADCLFDLSWLPPPEVGTGAGILTVFEHGDAFARADLDAYDMALEIWQEAAEAWRRIGVPFTVLLRPEA